MPRFFPPNLTVQSLTCTQANKEEGHICHIYCAEASPFGALPVRWTRYVQNRRCKQEVYRSRVSAACTSHTILYNLTERRRYKEAGEALKRKQDKEREAAGLPPVQRVGGRGAALAQRGQQRGGPGGRGGGSSATARGGRGGGAPRTLHTATDKNLYVHLLGHLRKKALLPVVVFTFSKKRCEENAATLTNADLCNSVEKSEVHVAIEKALARLKG